MNNSNNNNIYVFYHSPCLDGSLAAWAAHKVFGDSAKYIGAGYRSYENIKEALSAEQGKAKIFFLDYVPSTEVLLWILENGHNVEIYDHHEVSFSTIRGLEGKNLSCVLDCEKSGAGISWDEFIKQPRPLLVNTIEAIDIGRSEFFDSDDQCYNVSAFFYGLSLSKIGDIHHIFALFDKFSNWKMEEFEKMGCEHREKFKLLIPEALKDVEYVNIPQLGLEEIPFVNTDIYCHGGDLTREIFRKYDSTVAMIWFQEGDDNYRINVRSNGKILAKEVVATVKERMICRGCGHPKSMILRMTEAQFLEFRKIFV